MHRIILVVALVVSVCALGLATPQESQASEPTRLVIPADRSRSFVVAWPTSFPERERAMWLAYLLRRVEYLKTHHDSLPKTDGPVIPSFPEEVEARTATARTYRNLQTKDPNLDIPYFNDLAKTLEAGLLPEYAWTYLRQETWLEQPSGLRLDAFTKWRDQNLASHKVQTEGHISVAKHQQ